MSSQTPKNFLAELGFTKLAVAPNSQTTGDRVRSILQSEKLTGVFLVGENPRLQAELEALGIRFNVLNDEESVPAHVFLLEEHHGFWGSVNVESGVVRDVDFAMDSVGAVRVLLGQLYPEFRHMYAVRPVSVQVLHGPSVTLPKLNAVGQRSSAAELAEIGLFKKPVPQPGA